MQPISFENEDFDYLASLVEKDELAGLSDDNERNVPNFRRLLLSSLDIAPDDPNVIRLFQSHLAPVKGDTTEFSRVAHRVCLIERLDGAESTGILMGPDLLLTAAHTLRGIRGIFADPKNVRVRFDRFGTNPPDVAPGPSCGLLKTAGLGQPVVVASSIKVVDNRVVEDNGLDYILVRLDERIGEAALPRVSVERGWIDGSRAEIAPKGSVTVLQHPRGERMHFARGQVFNTHKGRIHYTVDVAGGASGSPILDTHKRIVGIHTGQVNEYERVGTSFQAIFADVQKRGSGPLEEPEPVFLPFPPPRVAPAEAA